MQNDILDFEKELGLEFDLKEKEKPLLDEPIDISKKDEDDKSIVRADTFENLIE